MKRSVVYTVLSLGVTAGIFAWLLRTTDPDDILALLRGVDPRGIAVFVLFSLAGTFFRAWRYRLVLAVSGYRPGNFPLFLAVLVYKTFADFLPARLGSLAYVYVATARLGVPFGPAASSLALSTVFDLVALAPLLALAALLLGAGASLPPWALVAGAALLAVLTVGLLFLLPALARAAAAVAKRIPLAGRSLRSRLSKAFEDTAQEILLARRAGISLRLFGLSVAVRLCKYAGLYVFLLGLVLPLGWGPDRLPVPAVFTGLVAAEMAASLPVSGIAGFGAYEGAWSLVFQALLFPADLAASTSIAHHLFTQVYGYSLGAVAILLLLLPIGRARELSSPLPQPVQPSTTFWPALLLALSAAFAGAWSLYALLPAVELRAAQQSAHGSAGEPAPALQPGSPPLQGLLVCEGPDGVHLLRLGEGRSALLVPGGAYPRFSPDGRFVASVRKRHVVVTALDGSGTREVVEAAEPRAVAFTPDGARLVFSDGKELLAVALAGGRTTSLYRGHLVREVDAGPGNLVAITIREFGMTRILGIDTTSGQSWRVTAGCSASLSPDGGTVTCNSGDHRTLDLRDPRGGKLRAVLAAPAGLRFDNHFWSNDPDWIVSTEEDAGRILAHQLSTGFAWRITQDGACDRADLFVLKHAAPDG